MYAPHLEGHHAFAHPHAHAHFWMGPRILTLSVARPCPPSWHAHQEGKLPKDKRNRLWALGKPERGFLYLSLTATAFSGAMFPVFSLMLSTIITFFYLDDPDELERKVRVVLAFVVAACGRCVVGAVGAVRVVVSYVRL